jgi:hypothetical protein
MEPVLSQTERPPPKVATGDARTSALNNFYILRNRAAFTVVTQDVLSKRKEHPGLEDTFVELRDCVRSSAGTQSSLLTLRVSRLLVEMREIAANPHPMYDCYVSESDMFFWKVVIQGVSSVLSNSLMRPRTRTANFYCISRCPRTSLPFPPKAVLILKLYTLM